MFMFIFSSCSCLCFVHVRLAAASQPSPAQSSQPCLVVSLSLIFEFIRKQEMQENAIRMPPVNRLLLMRREEESFREWNCHVPVHSVRRFWLGADSGMRSARGLPVDALNRSRLGCIQRHVLLPVLGIAVRTSSTHLSVVCVLSDTAMPVITKIYSRRQAGRFTKLHTARLRTQPHH